MSSVIGHTALRELEARIKSLRDQEQLKRQRDLFRNTRDLTRERRDGVRSALGQVKALRTIEANEHVLETEEKTCLTAAQAKARELVALTTSGTPDSSKIGARLDAVKRATTTVNDAVTTTWSGICRQYEDRAKALRPLAEKLSPPALVSIDALSRLLRYHSSGPPTSVAALQSLLDAIRAFNTAINSMKIDGLVGQFLRDASTGGADPKALFEPEIKKYLDDNPALWTSLRITLK
jgi:hypothetical protein